MRNDVLKEVEKKNNAHKKMRKWYGAVICLAVLVAVFTVYKLIVPATALEKKLICTVQEHQHTDECYTATEGENILTCDMSEHVHDVTACYESVGAEPATESLTGDEVETVAETVSESETTTSDETETGKEPSGEAGTEVATETETQTSGESENETDSETENATDLEDETATEETTETVFETEEETIEGNESNDGLVLGAVDNQNGAKAVIDCGNGIGIVQGIENVPITIDMFNYTNAVNYEELANPNVDEAYSNPQSQRFTNTSGFRFWQGRNNYYTDGDTDGDGDTGDKWDKYGSVDGQGATDGSGGPVDSERQRLVVTKTYGLVQQKLQDGSPYINGYTADDNPEKFNFAGGSMDYLFDRNYQAKEVVDGKATGNTISYYKGTMENGGGLFQLDKDGYFYYNSAKNAAYYDAEKNKFTLYDHVIRPIHEARNGRKTNDTRSGNFLPFNEVTQETTSHLDDSRGNFISTEDSKTQKSGIHRLELTTPVDYWFGMTMEYEFYMPKDGKVNGNDMIFEFAGDDDVYVFVDDVLFLDLGGIHGSVEGTINFATGVCTEIFDTENNDGDPPSVTNTFAQRLTGVENPPTLSEGRFADYTKHKLKFFYMERGGNLSHCSIRFNLQSSLDVTKQLNVSEGINGKLTDTVDYLYRVVDADDKDSLYLKEGTEYYIVTRGEDGEIKENLGTLDTNYVGANGIFSIKSGQTAYFPSISLLGIEDNPSLTYAIQELIPKAYANQYMVPTLDGDGTELTKKEITLDGVEYIVYETNNLSAATDQKVTYTNHIDEEKLCALNLIKETVGEFDENTTFEMSVKLGGIPIPIGTEYTLYESADAQNGTVQTVETEGIIPLKAGQKATIANILSGTTYEVSEVGGDQYAVKYSGAIVAREENGTDQTIEWPDLSHPTDAFGEGETIEITITNYSEVVEATIPLSKTCLFNNGTFDFQFQIMVGGTFTEEGGYQGGTPKEPVDVTVTGSDTINQDVKFAIPSNAFVDDVCYLKVNEINGGGDFIYDTTYYIVVLTLNGEGTADITKVYEYAYEGASGTPVTDWAENPTLAFENQRITSVTVTKTVEGIETDEKFTFTVTVTLPDGTNYALPAEDASFELGHGESRTIKNIPYGADVTVTEIDSEGYSTTWIVETLQESENGESGGQAIADRPRQNGNVGTEKVVAATAFHFYNTYAYELPETGGKGTVPYILGGVITLLVALFAYILCRKKQYKT